MSLFGSSSLLSYVTPPGKVVGTGILPASQQLLSQFGRVDQSLIDLIIAALPGTFGGYPNHADKAPSALFTAVFAVLAVAFYFVFVKDYMRGHRFWPFFGLGSYALLRTIGWGMRIKWSQDVLQVKLGLASYVFILVAVLFINMLNMLFGHRIFTWRHPETGNAKWFNAIMTFAYVLVFGVIVMAIVGQVVPYIYFLDQHHLDMCHKVVQAAAILQVLYAFAGIQLIAAAYLFTPGTIDHRFGSIGKKDTAAHGLPKTLSATWLESAGIFYYPRKGSQEVHHKGDPQADYIRVIASNKPPASGLADHNDVHPNGPNMSVAIALIVVTSILLCISSCFRCASAFKIAQYGGNTTPIPFIFRPWVLYLFYGAFEAIVCVMFLVWRADLRFYIPDMVSRSKATRGQDSNTMVPVGSDPVQKNESAFVA